MEVDITRFYSTRWVADLFGVSTETVRRIIKRGELEAVRIGGCFRIHGWSLRYYLSNLQ